MLLVVSLRTASGRGETYFLNNYITKSVSGFDDVYLYGLRPQPYSYQKRFTLIRMGYTLNNTDYLMKKHGKEIPIEINFSESVDITTRLKLQIKKY